MDQAYTAPSDYRIIVRQYVALPSLKLPDSKASRIFGDLSINMGLGLKPIHNEIAFMRGENTVAVFNGDPYDRETGDDSFHFPNDKDTLRVSASGRSRKAYAPQFPFQREAVLFQGNEDKYFELLGKATEASLKINSMNVNYVMLGLTTPSQNSNSVSSTLVRVMGLQLPPEIKSQWAPGQDLDLLPLDFKTRFDGISRNTQWISNPEFQNYRSFIDDGLKELSSRNVRQQACECVLPDPQAVAAPPEAAKPPGDAHGAASVPSRGHTKAPGMGM